MCYYLGITLEFTSSSSLEENCFISLERLNGNFNLIAVSRKQWKWTWKPITELLVTVTAWLVKRELRGARWWASWFAAPEHVTIKSVLAIAAVKETTIDCGRWKDEKDKEVLTKIRKRQCCSDQSFWYVLSMFPLILINPKCNISHSNTWLDWPTDRLTAFPPWL